MRKVKLKRKQLIIDLIRQDLIYYRWTNLLCNAELSLSDSYAMELDKIIFNQLSLDQHQDIDVIYDRYMKLAKKVMNIRNLGEELTRLAMEIYNYLERKIKNQKAISKKG